MKYKDMATGVENGTLKIDYCGHTINDPTKKLLKDVQHILKYANGAGDGTWGSLKDGDTMDDMNVRMRELYTDMLERDYAPGEAMWRGPESYCFNCGETFKLVYTGESLAVAGVFNPDTKRMEMQKCRCPMENPSPYVGHMMTSGSLVFTNFFRCDDCKEEDKHTDQFNLNCLAGRRNIADYKLANFNVAYGQMGNMSVGVFINKQRNSIIIGNPNVGDQRADKMTEAEFKACDKKKLHLIEDHKLVGRICLDVWRWEAGDKETLGPLYEEVKNRECADVVEAKVKPGKWKVSHFYDSSHEDLEVYSRLELVS